LSSPWGLWSTNKKPNAWLESSQVKSLTAKTRFFRNNWCLWKKRPRNSFQDSGNIVQWYVFVRLHGIVFPDSRSVQ
jgi:hypothetical protein